MTKETYCIYDIYFEVNNDQLTLVVSIVPEMSSGKYFNCELKDGPSVKINKVDSEPKNDGGKANGMRREYLRTYDIDKNGKFIQVDVEHTYIKHEIPDGNGGFSSLDHTATHDVIDPRF